jgi:TRAP-type C4-dicarboxylate transport system permease small subunit
VSATLSRLRSGAGALADGVAAGLLAAMFAAFLLQVASRYVFNAPIGWTQEVCLTAWLWVVFWGAGFCLDDRDHVKFDLLYVAASRRVQRILALVSALAIAAGIAAALPATLDYIAFYKIKRSTSLGIRLDYVFAVYGLFALAVIARYAVRAARIVTGREAETPRP